MQGSKAVCSKVISAVSRAVRSELPRVTPQLPIARAIPHVQAHTKSQGEIDQMYRQIDLETAGAHHPSRIGHE